MPNFLSLLFRKKKVQSSPPKYNSRVKGHWALIGDFAPGVSAVMTPLDLSLLERVPVPEIGTPSLVRTLGPLLEVVPR